MVDNNRQRIGVLIWAFFLMYVILDFLHVDHNRSSSGVAKERPIVPDELKKYVYKGDWSITGKDQMVPKLKSSGKVTFPLAFYESSFLARFYKSRWHNEQSQDMAFHFEYVPQYDELMLECFFPPNTTWPWMTGNLTYGDETWYGDLTSEECDSVLHIEAPVYALETERYAGFNYFISMTPPNILLILSTTKHIRDCQNNPAMAAKGSLLAGFLLCQLEILMVLVNFFGAFFHARIFDYIIIVWILQLVWYIITFKKLLSILWRSQNDELTDVLDRSQLNNVESVIFVRLFWMNLIFAFLMFIFSDILHVSTLILLLFFVPQIISNAIKRNRNTNSYIHIFGTVVSLSVMQLYHFACPENVFAYKPQLVSSIVAVSILFVSGIVLAFQQDRPRFFVPQVLRQNEYQYFRNENEEISIDSAEADCIIWMTALNLPNNTSSSISNTSKTMHTPCNHMFHQDCLLNWMEIKMECPICRITLPPLEQLYNNFKMQFNRLRPKPMYPNRRPISSCNTSVGSIRPKSVARIPNQDDLTSEVHQVKLAPKEIELSEVSRTTQRSSPGYYFKHGYKHRANGDFTRSEACYIKGLRIVPSDYSCRINLGVIQLKLGRSYDAEKTFTKALDYHKNDRIALFNRALAKLQSNQLREALTDLDLAIESNEKSVGQEFFKVRGMILYKLKRYTEALQSVNHISTFSVATQDTEKKPSRPVTAFRASRSPVNSFRHSRHSSLEYNPNVLDIQPPLESVTPNIIKIKDDPPVSLRRPQTAMSSGSSTKGRQKHVRLIKKVVVKDPVQKQASFKQASFARPKSVAASLPSEVSSFSTINTDEKVRRKRIEVDLLGYDSDSNHSSRGSIPGMDERDVVQQDANKQYVDETQLEDQLKKFQMTSGLDDIADSLLRARRSMMRANPKEYVALVEETIENRTLKRYRIPYYQMQQIRIEFKKDRLYFDYDKVINIVKRLKFFTEFDKAVWHRIFRIAQLAQLEADTVIFKQHEAADNMYVIIQGCVVIEKAGADMGPNPLTVATLSDGDQFGEMSLAETAQNKGRETKRNATCITKEKSDLLVVDKLEFHKLMLEYIEQDITVKMKFFKRIPFFEDVEDHQLLPLVSNLEPTKFELGDFIVEQGHDPPGLCIVKSGQLSVFTDVYATRNRQSGNYSNVRTRKQENRNFRTGDLQFTNQVSLENGHEPDDLHRIFNKEYEDFEAEEQNKKLFYAGLKTSDLSSRLLWQHQQALGFIPESYKKMDPEKYILNSQIDYRVLKEGDYFGGRSLLQGEVLDPNFKHWPAKFSVVANSAKVEIFIITKWHMQLFTDVVRNRFREQLKYVDDMDAPEKVDLLAVRQDYKEWEKKKQTLIDGIQRHRFVERNKGKPLFRV